MTRHEQQLRDEIALREASISDARREVAAGELSADDAAVIEARDGAALASAKRALATLTPTTVATRRRRRGLLVGALGCFTAAVVVLLWASLAPRQPGNSITGSVSLARAQRVTQLLDEAQVDVAYANAVAALSAYRQVLSLDPHNVAALTQTGWLEFSAGSSSTIPALVALGVRALRTAIADAPRDPAPRLYYAIVAYSTPGNRALAVKEFRVFLGLNPSRAQLAIARPLLQQLGLRAS